MRRRPPAGCRSLLAHEGIAIDCLIDSPEIPTIVKTRIIARQQQVVRVDRKDAWPASNIAHDSAFEQPGEMLA